MKHTATPWQARKGDVLNPDRSWGIVKPLSREACIEIDGEDSAYGYRSEIIAEVCAAGGGIDQADAEFIVRAVNSHEDLLEACKALQQWIEDNAPETGDPQAEWCDQLDLSRAAIANAES